MSDVKPEGIAVLGSHPATKKLAPFDKNWLIYTCSPDNSPYGHRPEPIPRFDAWFEVHVPVFDISRPYKYLFWLKNAPVLYMRDKLAMGMTNGQGERLFPTATEYPTEETEKEFGPFTWTSSITFIMAKAILDCMKLGIDQMGLWGIMQASETEYKYQRPGVQNMIWEASKRGITVYAPDVSGLFEKQREVF